MVILATLLLQLTTPDDPGTSALQSRTQAHADGVAIAVSDMVPRILSYTRWPTEKRIIRLCMVGDTAMGRLINDRPLTGGRMMTVQRLRADREMLQSACDALYIGTLPAASRAILLRQLNDQPIASMTDADPQCIYGAMICLRVVPRGLTFALNVDAVTRSRVRIDPRVLLLARNGGAQP